MEVIINKSDIRLDKYLSEETDFSRSLIEAMIEEGAILVNGMQKKSAYKTILGDVVTINERFTKKQEITKSDIPINIVYEDEYLMVINKPSGLVVHPGSGNESNTLVNGLMNYTDSLSDEAGEARAGIVHRLDKDTSGLMLVAKTNKAHELLSEGFKNKSIQREYIALINGVFPSATAKINAPIGKSKEDFRKQDVKQGGKEAVTNLTVIKRYKKYTLVRLQLETGRTHQIRVHLNFIDYPVYNDPVYSNNKCTDFGQFLHSAYIKFTHPITKEVLEFDSKLPSEMDNFIKDLD